MIMNMGRQVSTDDGVALSGRAGPPAGLGDNATIPNATKHILCRAYKGGGACAGLYLIDKALETLSYKTRQDVAPLYEAGLVKEWFNPWVSPLYLTKRGVEVRRQFRRELGYDD